MDIVGGNIRKIRKARGLLQKQLADLAKMDPSNLSKLERGDYTWTKENLERIANALGVTIGELFEPSDGRAVSPSASVADQAVTLGSIDARLAELTRMVRDGFARTAPTEIDKVILREVPKNERAVPRRV
jgi:transcriptional regulator with XRE-family HTH domain